MRRIERGKTNLVQHRLHFALSGVRVTQLAGMADVKIHDDIVISRYLRNRRKHALCRRGQSRRYSA